MTEEVPLFSEEEQEEREFERRNEKLRGMRE